MSNPGQSAGSDDEPTSGDKSFARQLTRLIKREREVTNLTRKLAQIEVWSSATATLASAVSLSANRKEALEHLAHVLVDNRSFDFVRICWGEEVLDYPALTEPREIACIAWLFEAGAAKTNAEPGSELAHNDEPSEAAASGEPFAGAHHLVIRSRHQPEDAIELLTAYRSETFRYIEANDAAHRLDELAALLVHPFDALRLSFDLERERNALQAHVDDATKDLRAALHHADAARITAERAAQVRSQFLAHMSHEIRTPMTAIIGYAELLSDATAISEGDHARYLNIIRLSGRHLLQLLNDILDLARIESGLFTLEPIDGSLPQLLADVFSLLRVRAVGEGLDLRLAYGSPLPTLVRLDLPRLRQVLLNVVGNAIKFTDKGSVEVRARIEDTELPQHAAFVIDIEDTGVGIAPETLETIFEEFQTQRPLNAAIQAGTGLGLAISQRLVRLMGGSIEVQSDFGKGTCFTIRVPVELLEQTEWLQGPEGLAELADKTSATAQRRFRGRVLVAEDTKVIRAVVTAYLTNLGVEVDSVEDGQVACETVLADPTRYDIIFMDMQMPRMDGYEATRLLRSKGLKAPIVAFTAHAMLGERERCIEAGCSDYLTKPVDRNSLHALLEKYLIDVAAGTSMHAEDDIIAALVKDFYADLGHQREALRRALAERDIRSNGTLAHKLAGSAATFGFNELAARARTLEQAIRSGKGSLHALANQLIREITLVLNMEEATREQSSRVGRR